MTSILLRVMMAAAAVGADVTVDRVTCLNQPNCYRLSNGVVEVVVTTDVGPRIIRYGFVGEDNLLGEVPDDTVTTDLGVWKPWGGHRLWTAPEAMPRSYSPDNDRVAFTIEGSTIRLVQSVEPTIRPGRRRHRGPHPGRGRRRGGRRGGNRRLLGGDRKSTRLNSSRVRSRGTSASVATRVARSMLSSPTVMASGSGAADARRSTARMRASSWSAEKGFVR